MCFFNTEQIQVWERVWLSLSLEFGVWVEVDSKIFYLFI